MCRQPPCLLGCSADCGGGRSAFHGLWEPPQSLSQGSEDPCGGPGEPWEDPSPVEEYLRDQEAGSLPGLEYVASLYAGGSDEPAMLRSFTVDWMVDACLRLGLPNDALFLAVQLFDRSQAAAASQPGSAAAAQLSGLAALFVAAKLEDAAAPGASAFLRQLPADGRACASVRQLLGAETALLTAVEHRLATPTAKTFLRMFLHRACARRELYFLAGYLAELALLDGGLLASPPSRVAAAAYVVAHVLTSGRPCGEAHLRAVTGRGLGELGVAAARLARVHMAACNTTMPCAVSCKYLSRGMGAVAVLPPVSRQQLAALQAGTAWPATATCAAAAAAAQRRTTAPCGGLGTAECGR